MRVYTYSEARHRLAELLTRERRDGQVEIRRRDGQRFVVRAHNGGGSPLDVPGVDACLYPREIVRLVREGRRSRERLMRPDRMP